ncbi:hypothetical protein MMMDOFMJ_1621 [Methylobacterium gnaphalii]|nr:hypothetical protein MMMDOFMJ_1621 [Methylobacterium gnaphalii]
MWFDLSKLLEKQEPWLVVESLWLIGIVVSKA